MKVLSSMATRHWLADFSELTSGTGLPSLTLESVGGVDAARRVEAGEEVDLVILADDAMRRLVSVGLVDESSLTPLVVSHVAVAVASGTQDPALSPLAPAFPGSDELRVALRAATGIGYSTGPSGHALIDLIESWGLLPELRDRLVQARPGIPVARSLVSGDVDLGFQQASELIGEPGVEILGLMPQECAIITTFTGGVATSSTQPGIAKEVLAFMASPATAAVTVKQGFVLPER